MLEHTFHMHRFARAASGSNAARTWLFALSIAALLAIPATAFAGDSLLSGYGGPGGGEQVVLGAKLLPGSGGGGKGGGTGGGAAALRSAGATPPAVPASATLPSGGPASGLSRTTAAPAHHAATKPSSPSHTVAKVPAAAPLTAQPVRARTTAAGDAGSPIGTGGLLLVALGALALTLTAVGTRRLVTRSGPMGPGAAA